MRCKVIHRKKVNVPHYREFYANTSWFSKYSGIWMTWKIDLVKISKSQIHKIFHFYQNSSFVWSRKGCSRNEYVVLLFKIIFWGNNEINLIWNELAIERVIENAKIELIFRHASDLELIFSPCTNELWLEFTKYGLTIITLILYNSLLSCQLFDSTVYPPTYFPLLSCQLFNSTVYPPTYFPIRRGVHSTKIDFSTVYPPKKAIRNRYCFFGGVDNIKKDLVLCTPLKSNT